MRAGWRVLIALALLLPAAAWAEGQGVTVLSATLFLSLFVMQPVFERIYNDAVVPYQNDTLAFEPALQKAAAPLRQFMLAQTREDDIALFAGIARAGTFQTPDDVPFPVLAAAFLTSE